MKAEVFYQKHDVHSKKCVILIKAGGVVNHDAALTLFASILFEMKLTVNKFKCTPGFQGA